MLEINERRGEASTHLNVIVRLLTSFCCLGFCHQRLQLLQLRQKVVHWGSTHSLHHSSEGSCTDLSNLVGGGTDQGA